MLPSRLPVQSQDKKIKKAANSPSKPQSVGDPSAFNISVGDRVYLTTAQKYGLVKFIGKTHFAAGIWVGIELPDATGKNSGSVHGQKYFICRPMYVKIFANLTLNINC